MKENKKLTCPFIRVTAAPWYSGVNFLIGELITPDERLVVTGFDLIKIDKYTAAQPSFSLTTEKAQVLMDDLWHCGLRPTEGRGSAGSLLATEKHLGDMRKIAFELLKIEAKP